MSDVRTSVGALALRADMPAGEGYSKEYFGVYNSAAWRKGKRMIGALGGAVTLTALGRDILKERFGAHDFEGEDARFLAPEAQVEGIFGFFEERDPAHFELDPSREIQEELSREKIEGMGVIMPVEISAKVECLFVGTVRQPLPLDGSGTSVRGSAEAPTRRLFFVYDLFVDSWARDAMSSHPLCRFLERDEVASTNGGRAKGVTKDGVIIADNIFLL